MSPALPLTATKIFWCNNMLERRHSVFVHVQWAHGDTLFNFLVGGWEGSGHFWMKNCLVSFDATQQLNITQTFVKKYSKFRKFNLISFLLSPQEENEIDRSDGVVEVAIGGHWLQGEYKMTPELREYVNAMPNWTFPVAWTATYENWIF